jgi:hypothetical protein
MLCTGNICYATFSWLVMPSVNCITLFLGGYLINAIHFIPTVVDSQVINNDNC